MLETAQVASDYDQGYIIKLKYRIAVIEKEYNQLMATLQVRDDKIKKLENSVNEFKDR